MLSSCCCWCWFVNVIYEYDININYECNFDIIRTDCVVYGMHLIRFFKYECNRLVLVFLGQKDSRYIAIQ